MRIDSDRERKPLPRCIIRASAAVWAGGVHWPAAFRPLHDQKEEAMIQGYCGKSRRVSLCHPLLWAATLLAITATSAAAQFDRGKLSGTIKDEQGAVMPGVTVTARNLQREQVVTTVSDGTGFYTFPNLLPGRYTPRRTAHSSSGLGHRPLTAAARVRIPYGPSLPA